MININQNNASLKDREFAHQVNLVINNTPSEALISFRYRINNPDIDLQAQIFQC